MVNAQNEIIKCLFSGGKTLGQMLSEVPMDEESLRTDLGALCDKRYIRHEMLERGGALVQVYRLTDSYNEDLIQYLSTRR